MSLSNNSDHAMLVGSSTAMNELRSTMSLVARADITLLIFGETGTGKELIASWVHAHSPRRKGPFIALNCAAFSETLVESELFGHERGSFTDAFRTRSGAFEQAHGGTIFLDEIADMPWPIQAKVLRVLQGSPFARVGGAKPIQPDVRIIAATNRDLEVEITKGTFRDDLFERLEVIIIVAPPLRHRLDDIPELAQYFLEKFNMKHDRHIPGFTNAAIKKLQSYDWPRNVRELRNKIERAVVLKVDDSNIDETDVFLTFAFHNGSTGTALAQAPYRPITNDQLLLEHLKATLKYTNGNKAKAARIVGTSVDTVYRLLRKHTDGGD